jgi:hypothetical protein
LTGRVIGRPVATGGDEQDSQDEQGRNPHG